MIDRYIREIEPQEKFDRVAHILALGIGQHVSLEQALVRPLYGQIIDLCRFVLDSLKSVEDEDRDWSVEEVERVWLQLLNKTSALA